MTAQCPHCKTENPTDNVTVFHFTCIHCKKEFLLKSSAFEYWKINSSKGMTFEEFCKAHLREM